MNPVLVVGVLAALALPSCGGVSNDSNGDGGTHLADAKDAASDSTRDVSAGDDVGTEGRGDVSLGVDCGAPGQACCPTEACYGSGCCVDEICHGSGDPCGHGLGTCESGSCGGCGALGEVCCSEYLNEGCSGEVDSGSCPGCTQAGTTCTKGKCAACGAAGQKCCFDSCTDEYTYCHAFTDDAGVEETLCSTACGGPGQPCCQGDVCREGGCCMSTFAGAAECVASPTCGCTAGKCTTCGVQGNACCAGGLCGIDEGDCLGSAGAMTCQQEHP